jgi:hypothetical protein
MRTCWRRTELKPSIWKASPVACSASPNTYSASRMTSMTRCVVVDVGVGRQRQVGQQQRGQAALAALAAGEDGGDSSSGVANRRGFAAVAHPGVQVELVAVAQAVQAQRGAARSTSSRRRTRRAVARSAGPGTKRLAGRAIRSADVRSDRAAGAAAPVPFGQAVRPGPAAGRRRGAGQVEVELARARPAALAVGAMERELVHVVGGGQGVAVVLVVAGAVHGTCSPQLSRTRRGRQQQRRRPGRASAWRVRTAAGPVLVARADGCGAWRRLAPAAARAAAAGAMGRACSHSHTGATSSAASAGAAHWPSPRSAACTHFAARPRDRQCSRSGVAPAAACSSCQRGARPGKCSSARCVAARLSAIQSGPGSVHRGQRGQPQVQRRG